MWKSNNQTVETEEREINHCKNILILDFPKLPFDTNCIINVLNIRFRNHFSVYLLHNPWFGVEEGNSSLETWVWMILDGPNSLWQIFVIHIPHPQRTLCCESQSSLKCLGCQECPQPERGFCKSHLLSTRPILGCRRNKKLCNNPLYNLYFYIL